MRNPIVTIVALSSVLTLAAAPAAAQGEFGAGVSILNGEDGTGAGFAVDYSRVFRTFSGGGTLGWVADFSMNDNSDDEIRMTTLMGGVRYSRRATERLTWFAQGLVGLGRVAASGESGDVCDELDLDCSENELAVAPGAGVNVAVGPRVSIRAQIDFLTLTAENDAFNARRFWFGASLPLGAMP